MFRVVFAFVLGMAVGMLELAAGYNYHIVRTDEKWLIVPRVQLGLADAFADVRGWSIADWRKHPQLVAHVLKAGHGDLLRDQAVEQVSEFVTGAVEQSTKDVREQVDSLRREAAPLFPTTSSAPAANSAPMPGRLGERPPSRARDLQPR